MVCFGVGMCVGGGGGINDAAERVCGCCYMCARVHVPLCTHHTHHHTHLTHTTTTHTSPTHHIGTTNCSCIPGVSQQVAHPGSSAARRHT